MVFDGLCFQAIEENNLLQEENVMKHYGFKLRPANVTSYGQIVTMLSQCRNTCRKHIKKINQTDIPQELKELGYYEDVVKDAFGVTYDMCDLAGGITKKAMEVFFNMYPNSRGQMKVVPQLHEIGFEKLKIPRDVYAAILTNRKKLLSNGKKWLIEYCSEGDSFDFQKLQNLSKLFIYPGLQNCNKVYESVKAKECHMVSSERYQFLDLDFSTKRWVFDTMLPLAEKWIGNKFRLIGSNVYGLRKYTRGARLAGQDKLQSIPKQSYHIALGFDYLNMA